MSWRVSQVLFQGLYLQSAYMFWEIMNFVQVHVRLKTPSWWLEWLLLLTVPPFPPGVGTPRASLIVLTVDTGLLYRNNKLKLFPRKTSLSWQQLSWKQSLLAEHRGHWSAIHVSFFSGPGKMADSPPPFGFSLSSSCERTAKSHRN